MRRNRHPMGLIVVAVLSAVVACPQSAVASGDDDALALGQQAYESGDRAKANQWLSEAIQQDPQDPRPYYLRALCLARAGHPAEARASLVIAAALETRNPDRYSVAATLAQLASKDRALINQFRWRSQSTDVALALDRGEMAFHERPTPAVRTDAGVLRQPFSLPLERLAQATTLADLTAASANQTSTTAIETGSDPFADDSASQTSTDGQTAAEGKMPSGKLLGILGRAAASATPLPAFKGLRDQLSALPLPDDADQPAAAGHPTDADPFGSDVQPAAFDDEDPFGMPPATEDHPAPAGDEQPAAAPDEDPFG